MERKDLKIALTICPQWSIATPSFALGSLYTALNNAGFTSTNQIDINMMSSLFLEKEHPELFKKWTQEDPWSTKGVFWEEIVPLFQEYWFEIVKELSEYDIVAFTTYSSNIMTTDFLARYLREINPQIQIWYGGPFCWYGDSGGLEEASVNQSHGKGMQSKVEESMIKGMYREFVDVGCGTNEGEKTIVDLAESFINDSSTYQDVQGIWTWDRLRPSLPTVLPKGRSGRTPIYTGNLQILNLNTLETPTWTKEVLDGYTQVRLTDGHTNDFGRELTVPIQGSRGCTFKCTFCSETRMYRYRVADKLIEDILFLNKEYGVKNFWFTDSLINGSISQYKRFVDKLLELQESGELPKIRYGGYFRTHRKMDLEFMNKARKSGLVYMNIGVENGVHKTLALMEKNQTPQLIKDYLQAVTKDNQIIFDAGWIPGYPRETNVDFVSSLKFLFDTKENFKINEKRSGRINLMKGTDALVDTPLDTQKEIFGISNQYSLLKNWISDDFKNNIFLRHTRAHLTDLFLRIFNINTRGLILDVANDTSEIKFSIDYGTSMLSQVKSIGKSQDATAPRAQSWALDTSFYSLKNGTLNENIDDENLFKTSWLKPLKVGSNFQSILENGIIDEIRGFCWLLHNLYDEVDLKHFVNDNFKVFNLKDTYYTFALDFVKKKNNDFDLKFEYKIHLDDDDKKFIDIPGVSDITTNKTYSVSGNFDKYHRKNKKVEELYLDSVDYKKYRINLPRTATTGKY